MVLRKGALPGNGGDDVGVEALGEFDEASLRAAEVDAVAGYDHEALGATDQAGGPLDGVVAGAKVIGDKVAGAVRPPRYLDLLVPHILKDVQGDRAWPA